MSMMTMMSMKDILKVQQLLQMTQQKQGSFLIYQMMYILKNYLLI